MHFTNLKRLESKSYEVYWSDLKNEIAFRPSVNWPTVYFLKNGNPGTIFGWHFYFEKPRFIRTQFTYNSFNLPVSITEEEGTERRLIRNCLLEYDTFGNLRTEVIYYFDKNNILKKEIISYDYQSDSIKKIYVKSDRMYWMEESYLNEMKQVMEEKLIYKDLSIASWKRYYYNQEGLVIKKVKLNENEEPEYTETLKYSNQNLCEWQSNFRKESPLNTSEYICDENGKWTTMYNFKNGELIRVTERTFEFFE